MVAINLAYTAPINRPSQEPVLTMPQLWAALQHKIRHAEEFVPVITSTEVIEERVDDKKGVPVITRVVTFKGEAAPPIADKDGKVKEVCWEHSPCKVCVYVSSEIVSTTIPKTKKIPAIQEKEDRCDSHAALTEWQWPSIVAAHTLFLML